MEKIEIELDKQTLEDAKLLAEVRQCSLPDLMAEVIKPLGSAKVTKDPVRECNCIYLKKFFFQRRGIQ